MCQDDKMEQPITILPLADADADNLSLSRACLTNV
jgi:hypothetical protein